MSYKEIEQDIKLFEIKKARRDAQMGMVRYVICQAVATFLILGILGYCLSQTHTSLLTGILGFTDFGLLIADVSANIIYFMWDTVGDDAVGHYHRY